MPPDVPLRQFVLTFPPPLRFPIARDAGSALSLAPHLHAVLFDGAYRKDDAGHVHFVAASAIASRIERLLKRRKLLGGEQWSDDATDSSDPLLQLSLEAMKVPLAKKPSEPSTRSNSSTVRGFNLHCETRVSAHDEAARMRLFRYVLRPTGFVGDTGWSMGAFQQNY